MYTREDLAKAIDAYEDSRVLYELCSTAEHHEQFLLDTAKLKNILYFFNRLVVRNGKGYRYALNAFEVHPNVEVCDD